MTEAELRLFRIRALVMGVGRTGRPNDGMDMMADAVLRILDEPVATQHISRATRC